MGYPARIDLINNLNKFSLLTITPREVLFGEEINDLIKRVNEIFDTILIRANLQRVYTTWWKQLKPWYVLDGLSSIVVVGALTHCVFVHVLCDLKDERRT